MAFKPAKREVILKLSQPRFYRGFFCLLFGDLDKKASAIVQKLLQLQSFTFCPELYLAASGHNYNLFHGALIALLACTLLSSLSDLAHLASPQGCQFFPMIYPNHRIFLLEYVFFAALFLRWR